MAETTTTTLKDELIDQAGATPGDRIRVVLPDGTVHEGRLMPTHSFSRPGTLVLKLDNGYNIGLNTPEGTKLDLVAPEPAVSVPERKAPKGDKTLPTVQILGTGGTIASYVDYRTGAVHPAKRAEDLALMVPEVFDIANIRSKVVVEMFSEDMQPTEWQQIAEEVAKAFEAGARGVVIPHGTDTMGYTAAALAFMLPQLPGPVVLVGAQRSSDRPSSDAAMNLKAAVRIAATAHLGEVVVVMHDESDDTRLAIHRGVRVRKMHTSRRDAFRSINHPPLGYLEDDEVLLAAHIRPTTPLSEQKDGKVPRFLAMDEEVSMIQSYPGLWPDHILDVVKKGTILVGTGLGHVARRCLDAIRECTARGAYVVMTSQCLYGRTNMHVYATGRDLIHAGVISGEDMLPETAYVKLMWVLGQTQDPDEVRRNLHTNLVGEMDERTEMTTYLE
ncbi:MAG: Glu-tRNA(Gln) amidotransferase subunit GatD [Euryarchaeota archaeon]|nr:Glu-tRNA(Gln) amidotransferase subunit GatD [Euryarchaeota archaeon]